jgi:hypothetical protein
MIQKESNTNFTTDLSNKADLSFENLKKSLQGLHEILRITLDADDIYYKMGLDNIIGVYQNFLEMMLNDYGARQFMRKLRNSEIDIDIPLDFLESLEKGNTKQES